VEGEVPLSSIRNQVKRSENTETTKPFSKEEKRVTVELLRGKVPLSSIRNQLKTSE
jgi:hypothetical protein